MPDKNGPNMSSLARMMLDWEQLKLRLDELEAAIVDTVLQVGKTQTVGNIKASYSGGRKKYAYYAAGQDAPTDVIKTHTTMVATTDWKLVCQDAGIEDIPFTKSAPSVRVKLI